MGIVVENNASVSGVLMLPVLGLNIAVWLFCSFEETKIVYSLLSCVQHMLFKGILGCLGS